eukprot:27597-Chlamydomonas_euryale.AAC.10
MHASAIGTHRHETAAGPRRRGSRRRARRDRGTRVCMCAFVHSPSGASPSSWQLARRRDTLRHVAVVRSPNSRRRLRNCTPRRPRPRAPRECRPLSAARDLPTGAATGRTADGHGARRRARGAVPLAWGHHVYAPPRMLGLTLSCPSLSNPPQKRNATILPSLTSSNFNRSACQCAITSPGDEQTAVLSACALRGSG